MEGWNLTGRGKYESGLVGHVNRTFVHTHTHTHTTGTLFGAT